MKIVIQKVLKLWSLKLLSIKAAILKNVSETSERFYVFLHIFCSNGGSESAKLPDFLSW